MSVSENTKETSCVVRLSVSLAATGMPRKCKVCGAVERVSLPSEGFGAASNKKYILRR